MNKDTAIDIKYNSETPPQTDKQIVMQSGRITNKEKWNDGIFEQCYFL